MARTHAEVIEAHRVKIGAVKFHASYDPDCDPEDLAKALDAVWEETKSYNAVDPVLRMEATIEHYENVFREIRNMCQTNVREWVEESNKNPDLMDFKSQIFSKADMFALTLSMKSVIEYAERKNAT